MNWQTWLNGLVAAAIGGAAQTITGFAVGVEPDKIAFMAIASAITNVGHYLVQSPLPAEKITVSETTTVEAKKE